MSDNQSTDAQAAETESSTTETQDVSTLPQWAQDQLAKARRDAANYRTKLREAEPLARQAQELLDAQKTAEQRLADQLSEAQRVAEAARNEALRYRIATEFGLSEQQAEVLEHIASEEGMRLAAERFQAQSDARKRNGNVVPREGTTTAPQPDELREFTRQLFGSE